MECAHQDVRNYFKFNCHLKNVESILLNILRVEE